MSDRKPTFGENKMQTSKTDVALTFEGELRQQAADLIDTIEKYAPRPDMTKDESAEWTRRRALAFTNIQQGILWAIEAENI